VDDARYTITDSFDADFSVDLWHGHNVFIRNGDRVFRTYFINFRPPAIPRRRPTSGGTGTTATPMTPRLISGGSK
jgi:hypothetical protein